MTCPCMVLCLQHGTAPALSPGTQPHNAYTFKYTQITGTVNMTPHCLSVSLSPSLSGMMPANISLKDQAAATAVL